MERRWNRGARSEVMWGKKGVVNRVREGEVALQRWGRVWVVRRYGCIFLMFILLGGGGGGGVLLKGEREMFYSALVDIISRGCFLAVDYQ